jgi:hypothetical protein
LDNRDKIVDTPTTKVLLYIAVGHFRLKCTLGDTPSGDDLRRSTARFEVQVISKCSECRRADNSSSFEGGFEQFNGTEILVLVLSSTKS